MKNWLRLWKFRRPHDLETLLRAARPEAPDALVKAIAGEVRPQPAHRPRPLRIGRGVLVVGATALMIAAVSSAAGLNGTGPLSGVGSIFHGGSSGPASADQYAVGPHITGISPTQGTIGTVITITGTGLKEVDSVTINGTPAASFTHASTDLSASITATVASGTGASGHVTVTNTAGSDTSTDTFNFATGVPSISTQPHITGAQNLNGLALALVGNSLTVSDGTWNGSPTSFTYQWADCDSSYTNCSNIGGATSNAYTLASSDLGHTVKVFVTAHNGAGDSSPASPSQFDLRGNVGAANPTSENQAISGTPQVGNTLLAVNGSWGGTGTITFSYQWFQCGTSAPGGPNDCSAIGSATSGAYTPNSGDAGHFIGLHISGSTPNGSNGWSEFVATNAPVIGIASISSFSPTSGGTGKAVTISGSDFTGATSVKFNTTSAAFSVSGDGTQITTSVPAGATTGKISVVTPVGTATSSGIFTIVAVPSITTFAPTSGVTGNVITLTGKSFTGVTGVTFNGQPAFFNPVSDTSLTANVPAHATSGPIAVTTAAGTGTSTANFVIQQTPVISSFTPTSQQANAFVTVTGSNFTGTTSVALGANTLAAASVTVNSDTQLTLKVPSITAGDYQIQITNLAGTGNSGANTLHVGSLTAPGLVVTASPNHGHPATDGFSATTVTLTGTNFVGVTSVTFGGKPDLTYHVDSTTQITAHVPVGAITGPIKVTNAAGSGTSASFTVDQPPAISSFSPTSGVPGKTILISGVNLFRSGQTTTVKFGNSSAVTVPNPSVISASSPISVAVPGNATTGPIRVEVTNFGSFTTAATFTVGAQAHLTSIAPIVGTSGTLVTITGSNFLGGGTTTVKFGNLNAGAVTVVNNTTITATAPAPITTTRPLSADILVHNDAGNSNTLAGAFTYVAAPAAVQVSPTHGPANGQLSTFVTITGQNFTGATGVLFGTKPAVGVSVVDDTHITAFAPAGALTGGIKVTTPAGSNTVMPTFTVDPAPTITSFTPAAPAGADPGCSLCVVINGANFIVKGPGVTPAYTETVDHVTINGVGVTFQVVSATQIKASVPASGVTTGPIVVTNSLTGSATSATSLIVRAGPHIDSFSPGSGIVGNKVTINGSSLSGGGLTVTFNGTPASSVVVVSNSSVIATVPVNATTGPITVSRMIGATTFTDTSDDDFFIAQKPQLNGFDPSSGPGSAQATTVVDIFGSHLSGTSAVLFNGKASPFVAVNDDGDITAVVPAGATSGKISVVNPAGTVVSAGTFTVDGPPVVTSMTPTTGAVGDAITINGRNFIGEMGGTPYPNDTFVDTHGVFGATIDNITSSQIVVEVPAGTTTGPFLVEDVWGQTAVTPLFTIVNPPAIDDFYNEFTGLPSGKKGQPVVLFGSGFTGTTSVQFNGVSASNFLIVADWEIIVNVPKGATTGPITVTNPADTATTAPDNFTIIP